jgi:ADP-heptose:LPS heptosyltransferase
MAPYIDEIIEIKHINPGRLLRRINEIFRILKIIRKRKFDIVLDLHCALITNIISICSNAPLKLGIDKKNDLGLRLLKYSPLPEIQEIHRINAYLSILYLLDIEDRETKYSFNIPPENEDRALNLLKKCGCSSKETIIAFHPGTSWEIKQWGIEKFAGLSHILTARYSIKLIVIYGPQEKYFKEDEITKLFSPKTKPVNCPSIKTLAALLQKCDLLIGNDSGPIHLAAALKIPTVSIFGPSNHLVSRPLGDKHKVIRKDLPCSPCYGRFSVRFKCKNKNYRECLKSISVDDVLNTIEPIIKEVINVRQKKTRDKECL